MKRKSKFTQTTKIYWVKKYLAGEDTIYHISKTLNIHKSSFELWISIYQLFGGNGLAPRSKNTNYSKELKLAAAQEYICGKSSMRDVCKKYKILSHCQLRSWVLKYNGHEQLKNSATGGAIAMTQSRNITAEERMEIVRYCIENQYNYAQAARHFQVSYQQVYSWIAKYKKNGIEALQDRRGKTKLFEDMSEIEKLCVKNKFLEAQLRNQQMEIDFLKKLDEIERRRF